MTRIKKLDAGMKCIKRMLFSLNTIFLMIGVFLTVIGSTIHAVYSEFEFFINSYYFKPVECFIAVGVIMIVISIVGYIGTFKKSSMLVNLYALFLFLLLILEITAAFIGFFNSSNIYTNTQTNMLYSMSAYNHSNSTKESWDIMHQRLRCCGTNKPNDWANITDVIGPEVSTGNNNTFTVPSSCCTSISCTHIYARGCVTVLGNYASDSAITITCCVIIVLIIQIFGAIFATILAKALRRAKTEEEMKRQQNRQRIFEQLVYGQEEKVVTPVLYTPSSTDA